MVKLDVRGMACPKPVIETKKIIEKLESGLVEVLLDNKAAVENVSRLVKTLGCSVELNNDGEDFKLVITKGNQTEEVVEEKEDLNLISCCSTNMEQVLLINSPYMGGGSDELGKILMRSFFYTLAEAEVKFKAILFINGGIELTCKDSEILDSIKKLEDLGAEILSCGTCLNFNNMQDKLAIGNITNMYNIADYITNSKYKLISI